MKPRFEWKLFGFFSNLHTNQKSMLSTLAIAEDILFCTSLGVRLGTDSKVLCWFFLWTNFGKLISPS